MLQTLLLYVITVVVFLGLDFFGIKFLVRPVFERHLGDLLMIPPRMIPAAIFYLFYIAGLLWFVSLPALKAGAPLQALIGGAVLGALCYGTYEFTSYAIMQRWSFEQVVIDVVWGSVLTGVCAWAGVVALTGKLA